MTAVSVTAVSVKQGQQYYGADGGATVWQVIEVFGNPNGIFHARMVNVERPSELRTLTCSVLSDPDFYRLLSDAPEHGAATGTYQAKPARKRGFWQRDAA